MGGCSSGCNGQHMGTEGQRIFGENVKMGIENSVTASLRHTRIYYCDD